MPELNDVERGVRKLKQYRNLGLRKRRPPAESDAKRAAKQAATRRRAQAFAGAYDDQEFEDLIELCREHQRPLKLSLVDRLVAVELKEDRSLLVERAIKENWRKRRLDREIHKLCGSQRRGAGRRPLSVTSVEDALSDLVKLCERVERWKDLALGDMIKGLPRRIRNELRVTVESVQRLSKSAAKELDKTRSE